MYLSLAQIINTDFLGVTGVIATVLALIFGLGAYTNSRTRKRHMQELEKSQRQDQSMQFRPAKSHRPGRSTHPARSSVPPHKSSPRASSPRASTSPKSSSRSSSTPRPAPVAKSSTPPEDLVNPKKSDQPVLFRKVRPDGLDQQVDVSSDEDQEKYMWE
ncbi:hypothetical protein P0Y35_07780 [Kiritimatiellaeota bacterium B1221]|nr:hypothetical protein [Kiritimatiellaeota bacterium B1221]